MACWAHRRQSETDSRTCVSECVENNFVEMTIKGEMPSSRMLHFVSTNMQYDERSWTNRGCEFSLSVVCTMASLDVSATAPQKANPYGTRGYPRYLVQSV